MADIGDQLRFQPLRLHLLVHGLAHTVRDGVEVFRMLHESPVHVRRVHMVIQIAVSHGACRFLQDLHLRQRPDSRQQQEQRLKQQHINFLHSHDKLL